MPRNRDEMELLGFLPPRPGEDPRFGDDQIDVVDNGAGRDIENLEQDFRTGLDVEQDPFLPQVADDDGVPGYRPYVDASNSFTEADLDLESDGDLAVEDQEQDQEQTTDAQSGDDLAQIVGHREAAAIGEDGRPVSDFVKLARAEVAQHAQVTERAPYRRINPESAYTAMLGGQVKIPVGAGRDPTMVINWVGEDVEACPVTISLYPERTFDPYPAAGFTTPIPKGVATITWGTRNGRQTAVVDIGTGCQITVSASSVYVAVSHAVAAAGILNNTEINLSASLGFYASTKDAPATFTSYIINETTLVCARPPYASHVYFDRENTAVAWTLTFLNAFGSVSYTRVIAANTYLEEPIKLSNDVASISVANGGSAAGARLTWGLYL